jgi:hypothetical protein
MSKINKIIIGMQTTDLPSNYWATSDIEFPELEASKLVIQRNNQSVFDHTMSVIDLLGIKNPITLLSGLFHDLGKGCDIKADDLVRSRFPGHVRESTRIARENMERWQTSPYIIDRVLRIVSMHMYDIFGAREERTIRKFVADVGLDNVENWFALRVADSRSYGWQRQYHDRLMKPFRTVVMSYLKKQPQEISPTFFKQEVGNMQIEGGDAS